MASGLSPKLPLQIDPQDGYSLNKTYAEMVTQNLKMLILTAPGERIMDPKFGVGIRNYLFEPNYSTTHQEIDLKIKNQVNKYMPFLDVRTVILGPDEIQDGNPNLLKIQIKYLITPLQIFDVVEILFEDTI
jgi:phage baseplate assembly protein W